MDKGLIYWLNHSVETLLSNQEEEVVYTGVDLSVSKLVRFQLSKTPAHPRLNEAALLEAQTGRL